MAKTRLMFNWVLTNHIHEFTELLQQIYNSGGMVGYILINGLILCWIQTYCTNVCMYHVITVLEWRLV